MIKGRGRVHRGGMVQFRPLDPTVHHSSNPERTTPAESSAHKVPLDNMLKVTADDFLLFVLALAVELELGAELDDVALTVSCPEISEGKKGYAVSPFHCSMWPR